MHDKNDLHLTCSCHTHELHIQHDPLDGDITRMWYFSYWVRGYQTDTSWKWKLRQIWHILRKGTPYGDEVVLERHQMQELSNYIQEQLKLTEGK